MPRLCGMNVCQRAAGKPAAPLLSAVRDERGACVWVGIKAELLEDRGGGRVIQRLGAL